MKHYLFYPINKGDKPKLQDVAVSIGQARGKVQVLLDKRPDLRQSDIRIEDENGRIIK